MSKISFLPVDYEAPKSSNFYMKLQEGENKFRILSRPILGWEDWHDKKPVRYQMADKPAKPYDPKKPVKHFWAMIVWNYQAEEIQILQLTQATIRKSLEALCKDADWGMPYFYDLKVMKAGDGMETEYTLNPLPHKSLSPHIKDMFDERRCNLEALFHNEDPFSKDNVEFTPGIFCEEDLDTKTLTSEAPPTYKKITIEQAFEIEMILSECEEKYKAWVYNYMKQQYKIDCLSDLPADIYEFLKKAATQNMEANFARQRESAPEFTLIEDIK